MAPPASTCQMDTTEANSLGTSPGKAGAQAGQEQLPTHSPRQPIGVGGWTEGHRDSTQHRQTSAYARQLGGAPPGGKAIHPHDYTNAESLGHRLGKLTLVHQSVSSFSPPRPPGWLLEADFPSVKDQKASGLRAGQRAWGASSAPARGCGLTPQNQETFARGTPAHRAPRLPLVLVSRTCLPGSRAKPAFSELTPSTQLRTN